MKHNTIARALVVMTLLQTAAHAQELELPGPGASGGLTTVPMLPPSGQDSSQFAGSVHIGSISRKTGGALYTIKLRNALGLQRLDLRVVQSKAKIYSTILIAESGERINVRQLTNTAVLQMGSLTTSEVLNSNLRISAIEIQAESFSADASVVLVALSSVELPKLTLQAQAAVTAPVNPNIPLIPSAVTNGTVPSPTNPGSFAPPGGIPVTFPEASVNFTVGEQVLYNNQTLATVMSVRGDKVEINMGGNRNRIVFTSILEKSTRCLLDVCQGHTVIYGGNQYAQVKTVFASGRFIITFGGVESYLVDSYQVAKHQQQPGMAGGFEQCDSQRLFCIDDIIMYQNQYTGRITEIFGNGTVEISLNGYDTLYTVYADQLSGSQTCTTYGYGERICLNERAYMQGLGVVVMGLFKNGLAAVIMDGQMTETIVPVTSLSRSGSRVNFPGQTQAQFRVGQRVKFGRRTVTIKEIYNNGTARVSSGTLFGSDVYVNLNDLRL